jgi:flagellar biosynthesis protein FlhF
MKIKSYRAASLREALLQIKQELGEDALVLETKQVRAGGFFGVGARELIEVSVAPSPKPRPKPGPSGETGKSHREQSAKPRSGGVLGSLGVAKKIDLRDDSAALPARVESEAEATSSPTFAALAARTYANEQNALTATPPAARSAFSPAAPAAIPPASYSAIDSALPPAPPAANPPATPGTFAAAGTRRARVPGADALVPPPRRPRTGAAESRTARG